MNGGAKFCVLIITLQHWRDVIGSEITKGLQNWEYLTEQIL